MKRNSHGVLLTNWPVCLIFLYTLLHVPLTASLGKCPGSGITGSQGMILLHSPQIVQKCAFPQACFPTSPRTQEELTLNLIFSNQMGVGQTKQNESTSIWLLSCKHRVLNFFCKYDDWHLKTMYIQQDFWGPLESFHLAIPNQLHVTVTCGTAHNFFPWKSNTIS